MIYTTLDYGDMIADTKLLISRLPRRVDRVWAIPRKGLIPATIIAETLRVPLCVVGCGSLATQPPGEQGGSGEYSFHAAVAGGARHGVELLVDEGAHEGKTLAAARGQCLPLVGELISACVYVTEAYTGDAVHAVRIDSQTTLCEWDAFQHPCCREWMFDFDGVLCDDRDAEAIPDQSPEYFEWIKHAPALHIPQYGLHSVCTWRDDRTSREITQQWLLDNRVLLPWSKLYMPMRRGLYADAWEFKAAAYKDSDATMFVESDELQALRIANHSGKSVLCVNPWKVYNV